MFRPYEGKEFAMAKKKDTPVRLDQLTEEEKMKYEIADELGLLDRVMKDGWNINIYFCILCMISRVNPVPDFFICCNI